MAKQGFSFDDYVDVAERIKVFYEEYPEGRLVCGSPPQVVDIGGNPYIWYHARAYRSQADLFPGDGWAAEPVPGKTPYTKDSELQNAETAAWGRAIVALGFATKHIASAQEVRNRQGGNEPEPAEWMVEAQKQFKAWDIRFRDIPALKIRPEADGDETLLALKAWALGLHPSKDPFKDLCLLGKAYMDAKEAASAT